MRLQRLLWVTIFGLSAAFGTLLGNHLTARPPEPPAESEMRVTIATPDHLTGPAGPMRKNSRSIKSGGYDALGDRLWHFHMFNREAFLAQYHKRSNVETTMSMIKAKFGASVRAKTPIAQVNEVLLKCLCHNICVLVQSIYCVLVQSIYELELEPVFWS